MFRTYLPYISKGNSYYGIALAVKRLEDVKTLGASWWYDWTPTGGVPMLWAGKISSQIDKNYTEEILVFNEPNIKTQSNILPEDAVNLVRQIRDYYPYAKLVVGGVSIWAKDWLEKYFRLGGYADKIHIHAYIEEWIGLDEINNFIKGFLPFNKLVWITEFNNLNDNAKEFEEMIKLFKGFSQIERIAPYTNTQPHTGKIWELPICVELFNENGLTEKGKIYSKYCKSN